MNPLVHQLPRNKNCMSSGLSFSMAMSSLLIVPLIMLAFFSCNMTMRDSTESSIQSLVMTQGRFWPMRWQRSADCHSAAGFHHLKDRRLAMNNRYYQHRGSSKESTYGSTIKTLEASVRFSATPPALRDTKKTSTFVLFIKYSIDF